MLCALTKAAGKVKKMKKILSLLIMSVMAFSIMCSSFSVHAASLTVSANGSKNTYKPGDTVSIPINMTGNPGIWGAQVEVKFDASALQVYTILNGDYFTEGSGWTNASTVDDIDKVNSRGRYNFVGYGDSIEKNLEGDGTLFTMLFKIDESAAEGSYKISLGLGSGTYKGTFVDKDGKEFTPEFQDYDIVVKGEFKDNPQPATVTLPSSRAIAVTEVVNVNGTQINQAVTAANGQAKTTIVNEPPATGSPRDVVSQKAANGQFNNSDNPVGDITSSNGTDSNSSSSSGGISGLMIVVIVIGVIVVGVLVAVLVLVNKRSKENNVK